MWYYHDGVSIVEAAKVSVWVRRSGRPRWTLVAGTREMKISREDLLADDWEPYRWVEPDDRDVSEVRFSLLELR